MPKILATQEAEIGGIAILGQPGKKFIKIYLNK
jgi:hypothetical protein